MIVKLAKGGLLAVGVLALGAGIIFGREAWSYATSSARSVRSAVKENVPIEFQLRRARDLVDDIIPEMHANIRLIAQQEVEIDALKRRAALDVAHGYRSVNISSRGFCYVRP